MKNISKMLMKKQCKITILNDFTIILESFQPEAI